MYIIFNLLHKNILRLKTLIFFCNVKQVLHSCFQFSILIQHNIVLSFRFPANSEANALRCIKCSLRKCDKYQNFIFRNLIVPNQRSSLSPNQNVSYIRVQTVVSCGSSIWRSCWRTIILTEREPSQTEHFKPQALGQQ